MSMSCSSRAMISHFAQGLEIEKRGRVKANQFAGTDVTYDDRLNRVDPIHACQLSA